VTILRYIDTHRYAGLLLLAHMGTHEAHRSTQYTHNPADTGRYSAAPAHVDGDLSVYMLIH